MYYRYAPLLIIKQRQQQLIATLLVIILILSSTYYFFISSPATAATTHTWDDEVTLERTTQTETTVSDFALGTLDDTAIAGEGDLEIALNHENDVYYISNFSIPINLSGYLKHSLLADNLLYVSTHNGLDVLNTQGTIDFADDTLVTTYNTGSTPALPSNNTVDSFLTNDLLYVSTSDGGLSVINTQGTVDPGDDTLVTTYNTGSTPALASNYVSHSFLANDLLYVGTSGGGLSVINTQGTVDPGDDTLVTTYNTGSTPALPYDSIYDSFLVNDLLYVTTLDHVTVISLLGEDYNTSAAYLSLPQPLTTTPTTSLSFESEVTADHDVSIAYRTGTADAVWQDHFDTSGSYDADGIGGDGDQLFSTFNVADGILTLSTPPDASYSNIYFDTGFPSDHFPAGSIVTARVRANLDDSTNYESTMSVGGNSSSLTTANDWVIFTVEATGDFSTISFYNQLSDTYDLSDTWEIDYLSIVTPDSAGEWNAWSTDCTDTVCPIDEADLTGNSWIQYRLDLATDNPLTTPKVLSVTYNGSYEATNTYTSTTETFGTTQSLLNFDVTEETPTNTTITYEYSIDNATTWTPITSGTTLNQSATNFTWRATLATTDSTVTPTITAVTLSSTDYTSGGSSGTSIAKRIAKLEAEGKPEEAETLREKYTKPSSTTRTTLEIQYEIVLKAREVVTLLERLVGLRRADK